MKIVRTRSRKVRGKCAMLFVECLGVLQKDTMEGPLWRKTLHRILGSHDDAAGLVGWMCHGNGCRQKTTRFHYISSTKTGWSSLTHKRMIHQTLAQSLRESKVRFVVEEFNPLRRNLRTEVGAFLDSHTRQKNKALLLNLTIVNPFVSTNMDNAARLRGKHLADAVGRKKNTCTLSGLFHATYCILPLAMSTCGEAGPDVHAVIKSSPSGG